MGHLYPAFKAHKQIVCHVPLTKFIRELHIFPCLNYTGKQSRRPVFTLQTSQASESLLPPHEYDKVIVQIKVKSSKIVPRCRVHVKDISFFV